jgi:hypothetical protein
MLGVESKDKKLQIKKMSNLDLEKIIIPCSMTLTSDTCAITAVTP